MADESRKEYEAALARAADDVDYWYQTAQALCMHLARDYLTVGELQKLISDVEIDAACEFEPMEKMGRGLSDLVCLRMFDGLRTLREQRRRRKDGGDEG